MQSRAYRMIEKLDRDLGRLTEEKAEELLEANPGLKVYSDLRNDDSYATQFARGFLRNLLATSSPRIGEESALRLGELLEQYGLDEESKAVKDPYLAKYKARVLAQSVVDGKRDILNDDFLDFAAEMAARFGGERMRRLRAETGLVDTIIG